MPTNILQLIVVLVAGGAAGSLINEAFRRRRARTRSIPLIERVNRNAVASELRGISLVRIPAEPGQPQLPVGNVRQYELTLRNTSDRDLRGAEIQFEFSTMDVEPWTSRTSLSNTALARIDGDASEAWSKALRWRIPQFPPRDTVEFSFQVVDPKTEGYEVALYHVDNVVIQRTEGEPTEKPSRSPLWTILMAIGLCALAVTIGALANLGSNVFLGYVLKSKDEPSAAAASSRNEISPDEQEITRVITESQRRKYVEYFSHPNDLEATQLTDYWVPTEEGGVALQPILTSAKRLGRGGIRYGSESRAERFKVASIELLSPEFARATTTETWFLPAYGRGGERVQGCTPYFNGSGLYELRKLHSRWLIQSYWGAGLGGPDDCALRSGKIQ
jgi:hypothetical protein